MAVPLQHPVFDALFHPAGLGGLAWRQNGDADVRHILHACRCEGALQRHTVPPPHIAVGDDRHGCRRGRQRAVGAAGARDILRAADGRADTPERCAA